MHSDATKSIAPGRSSAAATYEGENGVPMGRRHVTSTRWSRIWTAPLLAKTRGGDELSIEFGQLQHNVKAVTVEHLSISVIRLSVHNQNRWESYEVGF